MRRLLPASALLLGMIMAAHAAAPPLLVPLENGKPRTPAEERATFDLPPGFRIDLVASEPHVVDPVAMAFDEKGRLFVCEMRGYPNEGVGTGAITSGRVRMLEDKDGDGVYETSSLVADGLRFPTGVMPWRGGLIVANAPDLLYIKDGKRRVLYTGFDLANIQQLVNSPQYAIDNWVHACAGGAGGTIRSAEKPDAPAVSLRGRGIRFKPDVPGSLEPTSGGGQYGLTADDWGQWFTATNSQHLRHIVLPDRYLKRSPNLAVRATTLDIPEHGAACKVFRKSAFEAWRVERTTRRAGSEDAARFPTTELVPGGYATSACSPVVYTADMFPPEYRRSVFVCDPANNLILRDVLVDDGATFVAKRGHADREFLTSTDNWFRPVHLTVGPDGALYVLDFYREVIETPLSLPDDIKRRVNGQSRGRGRIWRISAVGAAKATPFDTGDLVKELASPIAWRRLTAQRLLVETQDRAVVPAVKRLLRHDAAVARAHALWTLDGLGALTGDLVSLAFDDKEPGVVVQALMLAEKYAPRTRSLAARVAGTAEHPSPKVRFQAALSMGEIPPATRYLSLLVPRPDNDSWTETAILSSAGPTAPDLLGKLTRAKSPSPSLLARLAALVAATATEDQLADVLKLTAKDDEDPTSVQLALLEGIGQGLAASGRSLAPLWDKPPPALRDAIAGVKMQFTRAACNARDEKRPLAERVTAVRLLAHGPFATAEDLAPELLTPRTPPELQLGMLRALASHSHPNVATILLTAWPSASPTLRREMSEALFARRERVAALVTALEKKQVLAMHLEPARLAQLHKLPDASLRQRAAKVLAGQRAPERRKVIDAYRAALDLKGDPANGKKVFQKNCATCHRLEGVGTQVGADLQAALRTKSAEALLTDILDPSQEVDPRYVAYQLTTIRGQVLSGIIAAETASSVTLKRGEAAEETVLRTQIEAIESTGKSLMPDGLEQQIGRQDMADLIAYLLRVK